MNIRCTQSTYPSACSGATISYYILRPVDVEPRGIVQISHGMCEYFTRYTSFAKYLCSLGFIVCGNDHLGHGSSVPPSGALGFFGQHNGGQTDGEFGICKKPQNRLESWQYL